MKSLIVPAAAAALCTALSCNSFAQSSVTIFGIIDAGVAHTSATGAGSVTGLANGGNATPRIGFRGTEDLGGGLGAGFWLEGQLSNDVGGGATQTAGLDFQRRSTVSLFGRFGEFRLGRDFAATYLNMTIFDAWAQRGLGTIELTGSTRNGVGSYVRVSNSVQYFLPDTLGGFFGNIQYAFGEQQSNKNVVANAAGISTNATDATTSKSGNYLGGRLGYANGPLVVAGSYGEFQDAVRTVGASNFATNYKLGNIGASYDFGPIKTLFLYQTEKTGGRGTVVGAKFHTASLGATAPLGSGTLRAQITRYDQANSPNDFNKWSVGYVYNLSKRTALYADVARINNKGASVIPVNNLSASIPSPAPVAGGSSTGYIVGVRHSF